MLVQTPESIADYEVSSPPTDASAAEVDSMFDDDGDGQAVAEVAESAGQETPIEAESPAELTPEDKAERLWWDKVEVLGKIKDCARMISEVEGEIEGYQDQIKEAKDVLKGQQALLARYSCQLADIMDGHPLPKSPAAQAAIETTAKDGESESGQVSWEDKPTAELLKGIKGCGAKKLEAIVELAPTAGKLEDLRGEASREHKQFREVLPKGCGDALADEIENRLIEHIAKAAGDEDEQDDDDN